MKTIGVVIPIYNTEEYLNECIESVINQTYKNIKIALVDDGSTDNSGKICDEYAKKDNRITIIHQNNLGKIRARYNGAKILECDYLTFVDSDDFIKKESYETFIEQMEQNIDIITWKAVFYHNNHHQGSTRLNYNIGLYDYEKIKKKIYPSMIWNVTLNSTGINVALWNKLVKRELLINALQAAQVINISYGDDSAVVFPLLKNAKSLFISDKELYYYRQRLTGKCPYYFTDSDFFKKLYLLYNYLLQYFADDPDLVKQLDLFSSQAFYDRNKAVYKNNITDYIYLFPFDKIMPRKKIILYGAGKVGRDYYNQIAGLEYANNILWVDQNYNNLKINEVKDPNCLKDNLNFDYAIIAIENKKIAQSVKDFILNTGISHEKIIWDIKQMKRFF